MGYSPGSWFKDAIAAANRLLDEGKSLDEIRPQSTRWRLHLSPP